MNILGQPVSTPAYSADKSKQRVLMWYQYINWQIL